MAMLRLSRTMAPVRAVPLLVGALVAAMGLLPIAPPEHVHEGDEHGHAHVVVHRHQALHGVADHHRQHESAVEDDDGPVLTLTTVYTVPIARGMPAPPPLVHFLAEPPAPNRLDPPAIDVARLIHGPPRAPTSPRAPPTTIAS